MESEYLESSFPCCIILFFFSFYHL